MRSFRNIIKTLLFLSLLSSCAGTNPHSIDSKTGIYRNDTDKYSLKISFGFKELNSGDATDLIKKLLPATPENTIYFYNEEKDMIFALYNSGLIKVEPKVRKPMLLHYYEQDFLTLGMENRDIKIQSVQRSKNDVIAEFEIDDKAGIIRILLIPESDTTENHNSFVFIICSKKNNFLNVKKELFKMSDSLIDNKHLN